MSFEKVKSYFEDLGLGSKVKRLNESSATVEEAAKAIGCEPKQIAKTMSFLLEETPILIVTAGDARIDNSKYKQYFHKKAKMISSDQVEDLVGHAPGGVCPFAVYPEVEVYLDISLKRFEKVYPAAGDGHSAVELTLDELEKYSGAKAWIDSSKDWYVNG